MAHDATFRVSADSQAPGAQPIATHVVDDLVTGQQRTRIESVALIGHPTNVIGLTPTAGVLAPGDYPNDGATGLVRAATIQTVQLAADGPAHNIAGLALLVRGGTGLSQLRLVASYDIPTRTATVHRPWTTIPDTTSVIRVGMLTWQRRWLLIIAEYEDAAAGGALIEPAYYGFPFDVPDAINTAGAYPGEQGISGTPIPAPRYCGRRATVENYGQTVDVRGPVGYAQARTMPEECLGSVIAKVRVVTVPSGGKRLALAAGVS